jgi:hypothetical protein
MERCSPDASKEIHRQPNHLSSPLNIIISSMRTQQKAFLDNVKQIILSVFLLLLISSRCESLAMAPIDSSYFSSSSTDAAGTTVEVTFPGTEADTPRFGLGYWSVSVHEIVYKSKLKK